jgi:hypothetical protein
LAAVVAFVADGVVPPLLPLEGLAGFEELSSSSSPQPTSAAAPSPATPSPDARSTVRRPKRRRVQ